MSDTLQRIKALAAAGSYHLSAHAYEEAENDGLFASDIVASLANAIVVEDYPNDQRGASVLALCTLSDGQPVHAVWGIANNNLNRAVLITVYLPNEDVWYTDYKTRRPR